LVFLYGQRRRFEALLKFQKHYDTGQFLKASSILDVGAGFGDFVTFAKEKYDIDKLNYTGTELVPQMIEIAKQKHPENKFELRDIIKNPYPDNSFDIVIGSGLFAFNHPQWEEFVFQLVTQMYKASKYVVAINFLTNHSSDDKFKYTSPADVDVIISKITSNKKIVQGYLPDDFTVYLFKDNGLKLDWKDISAPKGKPMVLVEGIDGDEHFGVQFVMDLADFRTDSEYGGYKELSYGILTKEKEIGPNGFLAHLFVRDDNGDTYYVYADRSAEKKESSLKLDWQSVILNNYEVSLIDTRDDSVMLSFGTIMAESEEDAIKKIIKKEHLNYTPSYKRLINNFAAKMVAQKVGGTISSLKLDWANIPLEISEEDKIPAIGSYWSFVDKDINNVSVSIDVIGGVRGYTKNLDKPVWNIFIHYNESFKGSKLPIKSQLTYFTAKQKATEIFYVLKAQGMNVKFLKDDHIQKIEEFIKKNNIIPSLKLEWVEKSYDDLEDFVTYCVNYIYERTSEFLRKYTLGKTETEQKKEIEKMIIPEKGSFDHPYMKFTVYDIYEEGGDMNIAAEKLNEEVQYWLNNTAKVM